MYLVHRLVYPSGVEPIASQVPYTVCCHINVGYHQLSH